MLDVEVYTYPPIHPLNDDYQDDDDDDDVLDPVTGNWNTLYPIDSYIHHHHHMYFPNEGIIRWDNNNNTNDDDDDDDTITECSRGSRKLSFDRIFVPSRQLPQSHMAIPTLRR
jgi:hypothetical protein